MREMRRWCAALVGLILLLSPWALAAEPADFDPAVVEGSATLQKMHIQSAAALLVDDSYQKILYRQNDHERRYPASITKVMTCLLVVEAIERGEITLDQVVTARDDLYTAIGSGGSTQKIKGGEQLTVEDLLCCALLTSANEACNVLATAVAGEISEFVVLMNRRAAELGMISTQFTNTHGYHDDRHYTTAYDLYLLVSEALKHPLFRELIATHTYTVPQSNLSKERVLYNTNALLVSEKPEYRCPAAIGVKTGTTPEAGYCLASAAVEDGRTLISIVLGAGRIKREDGSYLSQQFSESRRLLEWGLDEFEMQILAEPEEPVGEIPVTLSQETDVLLLKPTGALTALLPTDLDPDALTYTLDCPDTVEAPIDAGAVLGTLTVSCGGMTYGTLEVAAANGAERSLRLLIQDRAGRVLNHPLAKGLLILPAAGLILLFNRSRRRRRVKAGARR
ncbi:MAG: D-alanyl-D-alanine carboxypeptidase [Oscillospiraceae bacterium]|nr:D-alanyl-D-alanine carboxypeptidase [Oscillospiraceae bacterium]